MKFLDRLARSACLFSWAFFSPLWSENCPQTDCCEPVCCQPTYCCEIVYCTNNRLTFGGDYTRVHLKARGEPLFKGNLGGAHALYEHIRENGFYAGVEFDWRQGNTTGPAGSRYLLDLNADERFGYTWTDDCLQKTVYSGFGFRFLGHTFHSSLRSEAAFNSSFFPPFLTSIDSVRFQYYEFYFPIGFLSEYTINSYLSLGVDAAWQGQVFSTVQIRPLGGTFWSLTNTFGNFYVRGLVNFYFTKCKDFAIVISPFYERWQDGQTTAETSEGTELGLRKNTYDFFGVDVNFTYSF